MAQETREAPPPEDPVVLGPLPAGRHRFTREQVRHNQRERLIAGLAVAVAERGYAATTLADITRAASVSRRVFYENFESKDECFLAAFDIVIAHLQELMGEAAAPYEGDWARQVVAALRAELDFLAAEPDLARLCMVEALSAGPLVAERYREVVRDFIPMLRGGRAERGDGRPLPDSTEDSLLGSLTSMIGRQVAAGGAEQLTALLPDLAEFVLTPYLGAEEAHRFACEPWGREGTAA
jgi:AcrR family transcriptional regulator